MISKKGQGISINVIIIAAIALIVLVVLIAVFTGRMTIFGGGMDDMMRGRYCSDTPVGPGFDDDSYIVGGTWETDCGEVGKKPLYGKFQDAKNYPGKTCCVNE